MKYLHYMAVLSALALAACSGNSVKETLGLSRAAPDEFRVVSRPPLAVPPQFALRPPSSGNEAPGEMAADKQARSLISGKGADTSADSKPLSKKKKGAGADKPASGAESQFLKNAGADQADPRVRDELVEEKFSAQEKEEGSSWWDVLSTSTEKKDPLVDAKKEAQRIQKNTDEGKPVTDGTTPEVKAKDRGVLGRILGE